MKATIVEENENEPKNEFPCLRRAKLSGHIVFFEGKSRGIVIVEGKDCGIGYSSVGWVDYDDTNVWEPVNDITINFKMD